jgi:hypothetical protein
MPMMRLINFYLPFMVVNQKNNVLFFSLPIAKKNSIVWTMTYFSFYIKHYYQLIMDTKHYKEIKWKDIWSWICNHVWWFIYLLNFEIVIIWNSILYKGWHSN